MPTTQGEPMLELVPVVSAIVGSVIGSATAMIGKYYLDQFSESHKVNLSLAAKKRERFHERQATTLAGTFERATKAKEAARHFIGGFKFHIEDEPEVRLKLRKSIEKDFAVLREAAGEFDSFLTLNDFAIAKDMASQARTLCSIIRMCEMQYGDLYRDSFRTNFRGYSDDLSADIEKQEKSITVRYDRLKEAVRQALEGRDDDFEPKIKSQYRSVRSRVAAAWKGWQQGWA